MKPKAQNVRHQLAAASCALLGAAAARGQDSGGVIPEVQANGWSVDSALAYYHEDGRIQAIEPVVDVSKTFSAGQQLGLKLTADSLSGASPNGALPSNKAQTFAAPSGTSLSPVATSGKAAHPYTVLPGHLPEDPDYHDQRVAAAFSWDQSLTRLTQMSVGSKLSYEDDFFSTAVNASIAHDFNEKNTTASAQVNGEFDSINPIGGTPVPLSDYLLFDKSSSSEHKNGAGVLLGLTQVITPQWVAELNLTADRFTGYLNDPYKIISVIDPLGNTTGYLYEHRPDERTRRSGYLENRFGWGRASVALSMRYMTDDWQVHSETIQLTPRWWMQARTQYLEPTFRWYHQSAAYFYTPWLSGANADVGYASADQRLAALNAVTYGLKYGVKIDDARQELSLRIEYYQQRQTDRLAAPAVLEGLDLYPGLKAILVQVGWHF
ncbi:MAG TPA: DUF3570 domain-containing protein [Steroidobacteraceae bacterium]|nr:DUF3570 domain-containing protein [Steroidobacteraceae bacterium]